MVSEVKKYTILVVEDEVSMLKALRGKLLDEGFGVLEAKNGEEGLLHASISHPDLILLDLIMPVMDGVTMLKKLRAGDGWGKTVPVIILTNLTMAEGKKDEDVVEDEFTHYLVKTDWKINDIVKKTREVLGL